MKKMLSIALAFAALLVFGPAHAAGDVAAGKALSGTCAGCHAADGNATIPAYPKLAGQHEAYLFKQLKDFQSGLRKNATMKAQVAALCAGKRKADCEKAMRDVAAYFASQKTKPGAADKKLVTLGRNIYRGGNPSKGLSSCMGCHGPNGAGNPAAKFPKLAGQNAKYIEAQLRSFRSAGEITNPPKDLSTLPGRANDAGRMMQSIAARMSDREIKAVASYIAGLH